MRHAQDLARRRQAADELHGAVVTKEFDCRKGSCNVCSWKGGDVGGEEASMANGDSSLARLPERRISADELAAAGIRYLQVGGDWWNKCGDGWLNADAIFTRLPVGVLCEDWRTGRLIMRLDAGGGFAIADASVEIVYSEHMFEHMMPDDGAAFLREAYRVLKPGGVLRVTTPDLEKYMRGYVERLNNNFLYDHAARFPPMGGLARPELAKPYTAATVVNNIFRNYEHRWVYDFEEMVRTAEKAGIAATSVTKSTRMGPDLPPEFRRAAEAASRMSTARKQQGKNENPTRCWLEQEVREQESLYVTIRKPPI